MELIASFDVLLLKRYLISVGNDGHGVGSLSLVLESSVAAFSGEGLARKVPRGSWRGFFVSVWRVLVGVVERSRPKDSVLCV